MSHRLNPLLCPRSIAVVGASATPGAVGNQIVQNILEGDFRGALYVVNPKRDEVLGVRSYPSIRDLPETVEHVVFALSDTRLEAALEEAIAHGMKAATIMSSLVLENDTEPCIKDRVEKRLGDAGILVCGANGMGFYNFRDGVWISGYATRDHRLPGNVALISQSGSGMCGIVDVEERIDFCLAVSTGQELTIDLAAYLDFALEMPETRVVGLFMETVRDVPAMTAALEKARAKRIPVIAVKVGRTEKAAALTLSHSGALAGEDSAYEAYFDRHGVQRVADLDELTVAMIMFAQPHPVGPGGLVTLHDSGGLRQLVVDLADEYNVHLTDLAPATIATLDATLDPGLARVNPLDCWSAGAPDWNDKAADYMVALLADEGAAIGAVLHDREPDSKMYPSYREYIHRAHAATGKPCFFVSGRQGTGQDDRVVKWTREGHPVLDGYIPFLKGAQRLFDYRDFLARDRVTPPVVPDAALARWQGRLAGRPALDEATGAALLANFGIPTLPYARVRSALEAVASADGIGYPVVMKTAVAGIAHKSDVGGVILGLKDADAVADAYDDLRLRLGADAVVTSMADTSGVEMILGVTIDDQFGPLVMIGFGGIHAEILEDVTFLLPPFDAATARRRIDGLRLRPLLDGVRGNPAADIDSLADAAAKLSVLAVEMQDEIKEIDINPLMVTADGVLALDALVVPKGETEKQRRAG